MLLNHFFGNKQYLYQSSIKVFSIESILPPQLIQILNKSKMGKSYYDILQISEKSSPQQIKKAYKQLALKHHPDKNPSDRQKAKQNFTKIAEAYQVLSDPDKRQAYDRKKQQEFDSQSLKRSGNQYRWRNPEFDPNYNHFGNKSETAKINSKIFEVKDLKIPIFDTSKWFRQQFGAFTFQMAEQVFESIFKSLDKNYNQLRGSSSNINTISDSEKSPLAVKEWKQIAKVGLKSMSNYCPKNSVLIEEKTIERNGKLILVRKFNVTDENGASHKQIRETVLDSS